MLLQGSALSTGETPAPITPIWKTIRGVAVSEAPNACMLKCPVAEPDEIIALNRALHDYADVLAAMVAQVNCPSLLTLEDKQFIGHLPDRDVIDTTTFVAGNYDPEHHSYLKGNGVEEHCDRMSCLSGFNRFAKWSDILERRLNITIPDSFGDRCKDYSCPLPPRPVDSYLNWCI